MGTKVDISTNNNANFGVAEARPGHKSPNTYGRPAPGLQSGADVVAVATEVNVRGRPPRPTKTSTDAYFSSRGHVRTHIRRC